MKPITCPAQIVTGGGRSKGFTVEQYLSWTMLPTLRRTDAWNSLLCLYDRLGAAYDHFYQVLGFLSPEIRKLLQESQRSYADAYRTGLSPEYVQAYDLTQSLPDINEAYHETDYSEAYANLLTNQFLGGILDE